jgi:hypothetical protein
MPARDEGRVFHYGFQLRIPDGPLVDNDDPLLRALGADVASVVMTGVHRAALQAESVEPGRPLRPVIEPPDEDGDEVVGVWDQELTRCAGTLPWRTAARVAAAMEQGIDIALLSLSETRAAVDDQRLALEVLIALPATLSVEFDPALRVVRPHRPTRRRVVLLADEAGDVKWWDAAADNGPADIGELPVSQELRRELKKLRKAYSKLEADGDEPDGYELIETDWQRRALAQRGIKLWRRAREELGREFAVGYMGPGMDCPAWSPRELPDQDNDDDDFGY